MRLQQLFCGSAKVCLVVVALSGCKRTTNECTPSCGAGSVCVERACLRVCVADRDCPAPNLICVADLCRDGTRSGRPTILGIDSDGAPDPAKGHVAHHLHRRLTISGTHLLGSFVQLSAASHSWPLELCDTSDAQIIAELPPELTPGNYTLSVSTQAGECGATLPILQGEPSPVLVAQSLSSGERDGLVSPLVGQIIFNTTTGEMNYFNGSGWRSMASGFAVQRADVMLQGDINIGDTTPLWEYPLAGVPANAKAVLVGLYYAHGGQADHGYLSFWAHQRGKAAGGPSAAPFANAHYNDYYNTDYYELIVPWDKTLNDDVLQVEVTSSYNTNGLNKYTIYLRGFITAN